MARKSKIPAITLSGHDELVATVKQMMGALEDKELLPILFEGAKIIRTAVKRKAKKLTGRLKRAIKAKKAKRFRKHNPSAWCAVDRKIAPHSHLVENGHALVKDGKIIGNVPAQPFFRPGIESTKSQVRTVVVKGIARGLNAIKRRRVRRVKRK